MKTREEAIIAVRTWLTTPYVLGGRVPGAGLDCGTLLAEYLIAIGAATREDLEDLGFYSHDWFCHASSERYYLRLMRHARAVAETVCRGGVSAAPGSIVLFRVVGSKVFNHGAIVTRWPYGIHAVDPRVTECDLTKHFLTGFREMEVFDPWPAGSKS